MDEESFHQGAAKPQQHLQGGMELPYEQPLRAAEAMNNPRSASPDPMMSDWTFGSAPVQPLNPANKKTTS